MMLRPPSWTLMILLPIALLGADEAASWPCWRGNDGSGSALHPGPFVETLDKAKLVWTSEEQRMPSSYACLVGNAGGPVVADGRVYVSYLWPSGEVDQKHAMGGKRMDAGWEGRMKRTYEALGLTFVEFCEAIARKKADDTIVCIDLKTGKTLWKFVAPEATENVSLVSGGRGLGSGVKAGPHNIPAVAYGKVVAVGGSGMVYCVDAATGTEVWRQPLAPIKPGSRNNGGVVFGGGCFVLGTAKGCIGVDPATGKVRWEVPGSLGGILNPVRWLPKDGGEYIMAGATAIDPSTGKVLWTAANAVPGNVTAVAVNGEYLVCAGDGKTIGLHGYRITPKAATRVWALPASASAMNYCAPVILGGHAYCKGGGRSNPDKLSRIICVDLATGTETSSEDFRSDACGALIAGGGRLIYETMVFNADPKKLTLAGSTGDWTGDQAWYHSRSSTSCLIGDLLIIRGQNAVRCFDLKP